jgi:hypothetical protein
MNPADKAKVETDDNTAELNDAELDAVSGGAGYLNGAPSTIAKLGNVNPPPPSPSVVLTTNILSSLANTEEAIAENIKS